MIEKIKQLKNNFIQNDAIEIVKALILDINIFIIIFKKNSSFVVNEINLLNMLSFQDEIKSKGDFLELYNKYIQNIKVINNSFNDGFKHQLQSRTIKFILPIIEKNIILILLENFEFKVYKINDINEINDNNYYLSKIFKIDVDKLYLLNYVTLIIK